MLEFLLPPPDEFSAASIVEEIDSSKVKRFTNLIGAMEITCRLEMEENKIRG